MIYMTSMAIAPAGAQIVPCETDLMVLSKKVFTRMALAWRSANARRETKSPRTMCEILRKWRTRFRKTGFIFAKTAPFTAEEIARLRAAQPAGRRRMILLSNRELEPYFVYEWAAKEFEIDATAVSLEDLANTTHELYFHPRPKLAP
jgi:hypothetical protein